MNQIKSQMKINENIIKEEIEKRKNMVNELREEILEIFIKKDEQITNLEKSQLINEDNMMKLNKEFVQSLNELINKSNQKNDYEIKAVRSLIEASANKNEQNLEKMIGDEKEKISLLEKNMQEFNINFNGLDKYAKESIRGIEEKYEIFKDENNDYKTKLELFNDTLHKYMNENINVLTFKIKKSEDDINQLLNEESKKNSDKIQKISEFLEKNVKDTNEKIDEITHQILTILENNNKNKSNNENSLIKEPTNTNLIIIKEIIYNTCDEILQPVKQNFNNYNQELRNELNEKIENSKKIYSLEQIDSMTKIGDMLDKKIALLKNDLENDLNTTKSLIDGIIITYINESEYHIKEKYDKDIADIKKEISQLNSKIIIGT